MEQRSSDAVVKDAQIDLDGVDCAAGMGQRSNFLFSVWVVETKSSVVKCHKGTV